MLLSTPETKQPKLSPVIVVPAKKATKTRGKKFGKKNLISTMVGESLNPETEELEKAQLALAEAPENKQLAKRPRMSSETLFGDLFDDPAKVEVDEPSKKKSK